MCVCVCVRACVVGRGARERRRAGVQARARACLHSNWSRKGIAARRRGGAAAMGPMGLVMAASSHCPAIINPGHPSDRLGERGEDAVDVGREGRAGGRNGGGEEKDLGGWGGEKGAWEDGLEGERLRREIRWIS